jgi:hypothetical protein
MDADDDKSQTTTEWGLEALYFHESLPDGMTMTDNGAPCMENSGSEWIDLFFQTTPDIRYERLEELLSNSWKRDPGKTLQIIFLIGNCRKNEGGKQDRHNFHRCILWLWKTDDVVFRNVFHHISKHTCYKSILMILKDIIHPGSLEQDYLSAKAHKVIGAFENVTHSYTDKICTAKK